jgi:hypothetical protein
VIGDPAPIGEILLRAMPEETVEIARRASVLTVPSGLIQRQAIYMDRSAALEAVGLGD